MLSSNQIVGFFIPKYRMTVLFSCRLTSQIVYGVDNLHDTIEIFFHIRDRETLIVKSHDLNVTIRNIFPYSRRDRIDDRIKKKNDKLK